MTNTKKLLAYEFAIGILEQQSKKKPLIRMRDMKTMETASYSDAIELLVEHIKALHEEAWHEE